MMTPKELARKAVEDWLNKAADLPFGWAEDSRNPEYHASTLSVQDKADIQAFKLINRALKAIGSQDRYVPSGHRTEKHA